MSNIVLVATTGFDGRLERVDTEREVQRKLDGIVKCIKDLSNVCIVVGSSTWLAARSVLEAFKLAPIIVLTRQTDQSRYNIPAYIRSETTLESCQEFAQTFVLGGKTTFASLQSKLRPSHLCRCTMFACLLELMLACLLACFFVLTL